MDSIKNILTRGVEHIYPSRDELEKLLKSDKKLRVYQGFDPTSPKIHIGHMAGLRKLKEWQDLGHEVIFLIGDFTGMIGDPTGKDKTRTPLTKEEVLKNTKTYKKQVSKLLRFEGKNPIKIKYNSEWLGKLTSEEFIKLSSHITYQQLIERDMFQARKMAGIDITISELLYPIMQGYDSVAMDVNVEVGGTDQLFNMMIGRHMMHKIKQKNKFVMTTSLITDSKGQKIGKTTGNVISIEDRPDKLFAHIMNLPDDVIIKCLIQLTDIEMDKIHQIENSIKQGENPMQYKKMLAFEIVKQLNNEKDAKSAQDHFEQVFQKGNLPRNLNTNVKEGISLIDAISALNFSKSQAKRLIGGGAVEINSHVIKDGKIKTKKGQILKIGKKTYVKVGK